MALPLSTTGVSADRSIGEILITLKEIGFKKVAYMEEDNNKVVMGQWKGLNFQWNVNLKNVQDALIQDLGGRTQDWISQKDRRGRQKLNEIADKSEKIAWRVMLDQVKATAIAIQYNIIEPLQGFAGNLITRDKDGTELSLASLLARESLAGRICSPDMIKPILIEKID